MPVFRSILSARIMLTLMALAAAHDASALSTTAQGSTSMFPMGISCADVGNCNGYDFQFANLSISQFNPSLGVLTGAQLSSASNGPGTLSYSSNQSGRAELRTQVSYADAYLSAGRSTTGTTSTAGSLGGTNNAVSQSYLGGLLGTGQAQATVVQVIDVYKTGGNGTITGASAASSWQTLTAAMTYDYLRHANASFAASSDSNVLDLSAGDDFSVFALGSAADTTRLDAGSISCSGDCSAFSLGLASFQDLAAGQSVSGLTSLISGLAAGQYDATYTLNFADDNALGVGQRANALTLHLSGAVTAVPEPASAALMLGGLGALGLARRRRSPLSD